MKDVAESIAALGYHGLALTLRGHNRAAEDKHSGRLELWLEDLMCAWKRCSAEYPDLPIYLVGFSLGGLLSGLFVDRFPEVKVDKLVLLAPAFAPIRAIALVYPLFPLRFLGFSLPALLPQEFRAYNSTSLWNYSALLRGVRAFKKVPPSSFSKIPVLVIMSDKDELVSAVRTKRVCEKFGPTWKYLAVNPQAQGCRPYDHLLIDSKRVGSAEWQRIVGEIKQFLQN